MASIHITSTGSFAVHYVRNGKQAKKTFKSKTEAKKFQAMLLLSPQKAGARITVAMLLTQYRDTETVKKRGARSETLRINNFIRQSWANKNLDAITTRDLQQYLDNRTLAPGVRPGTTVGPATIIKEATILKTVFAWGLKQGYCTENPAKDIKKPREPEHRERVALEADKERLMAAVAWDGLTVPVDGPQLTVCAFLFACETGMRSGEILRIEESWIEGRVIHLPQEATKTAYRRDVALSKEALRLLDLARRYSNDICPFGALTDQTRDAFFRDVRDRAGLGPTFDSHGRMIREGLNFHDSRATFCTWAASPAEPGGAPRLELLALARQTGHKNLKTLMRYYRASAESLASRLD